MLRDPIVNLLVLYNIILAVNAAISLALWLQQRTDLHRALLFVWVATILSFFAQAAFSEGTLPIVLGFASVFAPNIALAHLIAISFGVTLDPRPYLVMLALGCGAAILLAQLEASFTVTALPVAVAVSLPLAVTAWRVIRDRWGALGIVGKALLLSCLAFCAHNLDFAFLRNLPEAALFGFTVAIFIITALSITSLAVVLELQAGKHARADAELAIARRIQSNIVPRQTRLGDLDIASYMRPTESVGGDYLDTFEHDGVQWLMLGDVTGHGLGAGLVMLMAQSTISALFHARPQMDPAELNFIANKVLFRNLSRLKEKRHMTAVAIRRTQHDGSITISGCHDKLMIFRAGDQSVEIHEANHFPLGLGFIGDLDAASFGQQTLMLQDGDLLLVCTDGVTEAARGGSIERGLFGEDGVMSILKANAGRPVEELKQALIGGLDAFTGGVYHDDVAFIVARARKGLGEPA